MKLKAENFIALQNYHKTGVSAQEVAERVTAVADPGFPVGRGLEANPLRAC